MAKENFAAQWVLMARCLEKLDCLEVLDEKKAEIIETLLRHQVLGDSALPGRRPLPVPNNLNGLFYTACDDPIHDTFHALYLLAKFGALARVHRDECIQGLLPPCFSNRYVDKVRVYQRAR